MPYLRRVFLAMLSSGLGWTFVRYVMSAAICADSLRGLCDIATLVHKTRAPADLAMVNMSTRNDRPLAICGNWQKVEALQEQ